jgi:hypothetical protein
LLGESGASVFALSFLPEVLSVDIELSTDGSGKHIRRQTRLLSKNQGKKAQLKPFRYLALAVPYDACISRVLGYVGDGEKILDFESEEC